MELQTQKTEIAVDQDIADLIPFFVQSRVEDLAHLKDLFASKRFDEMAKVSHTIKGISRPYGFPTLETIARELETACKKNDEQEVQKKINQVEQYLALYVTQ